MLTRRNDDGRPLDAGPARIEKDVGCEVSDFHHGV